MRRMTVALALFAIVVLTQSSEVAADGKERHYGDPFGKNERRERPSSVAFSVLVVESSLSAMREALERQENGQIEKRTERMRRAAIALVRATSRGRPSESPFASFATAVSERAEALVSASKAASWAAALSDVEVLERSFWAAKGTERARQINR